MRHSIARYVFGGVTLAFLACYAQPVRAQSKLIENMDVNKDGKVSRDEIPEGATRRMFDNMVTRFKLDPAKSFTVQELGQLTGFGASGSGSSNSSSRSTGSRRGLTSSRPGGLTSRAATDGRPFRALEELPDSYRSHDKDGDGQIGLYEWPRDRIREFVALDVNDDGFLTLSEVKKSSGGGEASREKKEEAKTPSEQTAP